MIIFYLITIIFFTTNVFSLIYSEGNRQSNSFMKMGKDYFKKLKTTRLKIFDKFRSLQTTGLFLVCTDVMAGGIDIADIEFDVPSSSTDFVRRCGRTARIWNRGAALKHQSKGYLLYILKHLTVSKVVSLPIHQLKFYQTGLLLLEMGSNLDGPIDVYLCLF